MNNLCELCWNNFADIEHHKQHSTNHIRGPKFECHQCKRWFSNKKARKRHFEATTCISSPVGRARCHVCDTILPQNKDLKQHKKVHKAEKAAVAVSQGRISAFSSTSVTQNPTVITSPEPPNSPVNTTPPTQNGHCEAQNDAFCELCWLTPSDTSSHHKTYPHTFGKTYTCTECNRWFSSKAGRSRHFAVTGCAMTPLEPLRCPYCDLLFPKLKGNHTGNTKALRDHRKTHELQGLEAGVTPLVPSTGIAPTMTFCELCWNEYSDIAHHKMSSVHLRGQYTKCTQCVVERWFSSNAARERHIADNCCLKTSEFRCCDCNISFPTAKRLSKHSRNTNIHKPREVVALGASDGYCEQCNKIFRSPAALATHLASIIHNPIMEPMKCLGGASCKKSFVTPSGMLAHLESGSCRSKVNRDIIDDLVIANDPTNIITDQVAVETRARDRMVLTSSEYSSSTGGSVMFTPSEASITYSNSSSEDWSDIFAATNGSDGTITPRVRRGSGSGSDTDSQSFQFMSCDSTADHPYLLTPSDSGDSGSGVYLTPSESGYSEGGVYLTPSDTSGSEIFTSTGSFSSQLQPTMLRCPLCPPTQTKQYRSVDALHTHIRSKVHAAKIYHCPSPAALGSDNSEKTQKKKQRSFTTLSGLTQHVEAGACEGGKATFNAAMAFVNEKLKGMGVADMKVIGQ